MTARVLLAHSMFWPNIGRLAIAFRKAGFAVDAIAPANHPIHRMRSPDRTFNYRRTSPYNSILEAIVASKPTLVVPCDDRIVGTLHELHREASARRVEADCSALVALIETSLGPPSSYEVVANRRLLGSLATLPDVHIPRTDPVDTFQQLRGWTQRYGFPAVLKLDGSSGGSDVLLIRKASQVVPRLLEMRIRKSALRRWKAFLFNRDVEPLFSPRRYSAAHVSVQSYIAGRVANCAIACWRGDVVASVAVEVLQNRSAFGLATIVRLVEGNAMVAAARSIAGHLKLSGLCGFDFVLDDDSKRAYLIEINPRATQINHFPACEGPDMATALLRSLSGTLPDNVPRSVPHDEVALFPQEWQRDPKSELLSSVFHDVPYEEPELVRFYGYRNDFAVQNADDRKPDSISRC